MPDPREVPKRVLVVDDEVDILDLVAMWLEDDPRCSEIRQSTDMASALSCVQLSCPDTIVLDFRLGNVTSAPALPQLRAACPNARIIIHTASRDEAYAADVLDLGADTIVEKASVSLPDMMELILQ